MPDPELVPLPNGEGLGVECREIFARLLVAADQRSNNSYVDHRSMSGLLISKGLTLLFEILTKDYLGSNDGIMNTLT